MSDRVEQLLRSALVPVEPSEALSDRLERGLSELTEVAAAELAESREELKKVLEGVATLPDDRREALIMRFALDMDNREIARALGRSEGATKVLIHRAIRQLEARLKEEGGGGDDG